MNKHRDYIILLIGCAIILIGFWSLQSVFYILAPAFLFFGIRDFILEKQKLQQFRFNMTDLVVLLMVVTEIVCYITSVYQPNSLEYVFKILVLSLFYYFVRYAFMQVFQIRLLTAFIAGYGFLLALISILTFLLFQFDISYEGFTDITEFRNLYTPLGFYSNEWVTVLLAILPFQIISLVNSKKKWFQIVFGLSLLITIYSIMLSFSRGAYIALLAFVAISFAWLIIQKVFLLKKILTIYLGLGTICILLVLPYYKSVMATISMSNTTSHQRSFEGRINVWKNSLKLVKQYPISGIGANNFSLKYNIQNQNEENGFSGRIANTYLQILVEKGGLGLIAYGLLFGSFFYCSYKRIRENTQDKISVIFFSVSVFSILLREMSFSSVLEVDPLLLLLLVIILNNTHYVDNKKMPQFFKA